MSDKSELKAELERKKQRIAQIREEKKRKEEEKKKKDVSLLPLDSISLFSKVPGYERLLLPLTITCLWPLTTETRVPQVRGLNRFIFLNNNSECGMRNKHM